ncbi:MAG: tetratricopeptide repeat protein [Pseudomonas sp.]|nr:tetratricopeptide repeat protein [Pseudomonas sp.]
MASSPSARPSSQPARWLWLLLGALLLLGSVGFAWWWTQGRAPEPLAAAHWVDEQQCQGCHAGAFKAWQGSHHQRAMQPASPQTVLADFNAAPLHNDVETTHFQRKGDEFWVNLPGPDGQPADFRVAYTFGVSPLQQYLVELEGGRLQALGAAWDVEKQAWFHLYPDQGVDHRDPLHWSGAQQNANFMCIECHTTGFERRFDSDLSQFASHWQALGVGCQSCHGPASNHLVWTREPERTDLRNHGLVVNLRDGGNRSEVETCARCHSRRSPLGDGYHAERPLFDDYLPATLSAGLYEVDGKIQDEVFEYGSFTQSRMHAAGVRCSDCHNAHSGALRLSGNAVCTQCHNPAGKAVRGEIRAGGLLAKQYDSPEHHRHPQDSPGAQCTSCHMPGRYYMGNDLRHDHSFSVPNPAQAVELGHGDACLGCHREADGQQVARQFQDWFGQPAPRDGGYARALQQARTGQVGAAQALYAQLARTDLPALRKAALLAEVPRYPGPAAAQLVAAALQHPEAVVRLAAIDVLPALATPEQQVQALAPLLGDGRRAVRLAATWQLAQLPTELRQGLPRWPAALAEYEQAQRSQLDRAEALTNLATLYQQTGRPEQAEASLRLALQRNTHFHPARLLLAQWLEGQGRRDEAQQFLQESIAAYPQEASLHHALGLTRVRAGQRDTALEALRKAQQLAPDNASYAYVLAVALHDAGQPEAARQLLQQQLARDPANREVRMALASYLQVAGRRQEAAVLLGELQLINPFDPSLRRSR